MSTLEAAQITSILEAAERLRDNGDHQALYDLLEPVSDGVTITGGELGEVYYFLGESCLGLYSLDAALHYYELALPLATGSAPEFIRARIEEIQHIDSAVDAEYQGVAGAGEASQVITAGEQALDRGDYEEATRWFQSAWSGIQLDDDQIARAAIGLAQCAMSTGQLDDADGYLQIASERGADHADTIAFYRQHLAERRAGATVGGDGVALGELDEIFRSAVGATYDGDYSTAAMLFQQMLDSGVMASTDEGRVWRNLGVTQIYLHDYDAARTSLSEAARVGTPETQRLASQMVTMLEANADARSIVEGLDLSAD
jgi:tetratricopeptide (TPR) repeat protein